MTISNIFSLLGGLGLFLYGMRMMREYLQEAAGNKIQQILKIVTATPLRGFFAGTGITAVVQSSTAVMVVLVEFVDAGILTLQQAAGVILGANIGTTVTSQMIALDAGALAPLCAFQGILLLLFSKNGRWKYVGGILSGLGVMIIGLGMMGENLAPLGKSHFFLSQLIKCENPVIGILAGAVFTALIQSSSASVGILQTLAKSGLIELNQSIYLVFGQNIGTCTTAFFASAGTGISAKRTAGLHLLINLIGTIFFLILCQMVPLAAWIEALTPMQPAKQIANIHMIFNIVTSLLLLPFVNLLVKLAEKLIPASSA